MVKAGFAGDDAPYVFAQRKTDKIVVPFSHPLLVVLVTPESWLEWDKKILMLEMKLKASVVSSP
jgi:hypothetical protein